MNWLPVVIQTALIILSAGVTYGVIQSKLGTLTTGQGEIKDTIKVLANGNEESRIREAVVAQQLGTITKTLGDHARVIEKNSDDLIQIKTQCKLICRYHGERG